VRKNRVDSGQRYRVKVFDSLWCEVSHLSRGNLSWNRAVALIQQWAADRERAAFNPDGDHPEWVGYPFLSIEGESNGES